MYCERGCLPCRTLACRQVGLLSRLTRHISAGRIFSADDRVFVRPYNAPSDSIGSTMPPFSGQTPSLGVVVAFCLFAAWESDGFSRQRTTGNSRYIMRDCTYSSMALLPIFMISI